MFQACPDLFMESVIFQSIFTPFRVEWYVETKICTLSMFVGTKWVSFSTLQEIEEINGYAYIGFHLVPQGSSLSSPIEYVYLISPWIAILIVR